MDKHTDSLKLFSGNKLGEQHAGFIREMLEENRGLKGLNLSHNDFRDDGGVEIAEGIGKSSENSGWFYFEIFSLDPMEIRNSVYLKTPRSLVAFTKIVIKTVPN